MKVLYKMKEMVEMIKLDIEKYKTHKVEVVLRPDFGTSPPIKVKFIGRIDVDDEGGVIDWEIWRICVFHS